MSLVMTSLCKRVQGKKHPICIINSRSTSSKSNWRVRKRRGILSVTIDRWHSRLWGLGFWSSAARSGGEASVLCCEGRFHAPGCGGFRAAAHSVCGTGSLSCRTPWRRSCVCRSSLWWWSRCWPPRCGSPGWSGGCCPGRPPVKRTREMSRMISAPSISLLQGRRASESTNPTACFYSNHLPNQ